MKDQLEVIRLHYEPRIRLYSEGYEISDWESRDCQRRRFEVLTETVGFSGASLLDVGCGSGDLYRYLVEEKGIDVDYTGVDILQGMIDTARCRHPGGRFIRADIAVEEIPGEYDVVFCSGVFNLDSGGGEEPHRRLVRRMTDIAGRDVVFNMLDERSPCREKRYRYFRPDKVLEWPEVARHEPRIITGYLNNDFTVHIKV